MACGTSTIAESARKAETSLHQSIPQAAVPNIARKKSTQYCRNEIRRSRTSVNNKAVAVANTASSKKESPQTKRISIAYLRGRARKEASSFQ